MAGVYGFAHLQPRTGSLGLSSPSPQRAAEPCTRPPRFQGCVTLPLSLASWELLLHRSFLLNQCLVQGCAKAPSARELVPFG